jgi:hypothetical protein
MSRGGTGLSLRGVFIGCKGRTLCAPQTVKKRRLGVLAVRRIV